MSYQQIRPGGFEVLPPVIKNLIIINGIVLLAQYTGEMWGYEKWITNTFALHNVQSSLFMPHQLITHVFMHSDFGHFFFAFRVFLRNFQYVFIKIIHLKIILLL